MFCNKCGAQCADDAKFCINCGNELPVKKIVPVNDEVISETETAQPVSEPEIAETVGEEFTQTQGETVENTIVEENSEEQNQEVPQEQNSYNDAGNYNAHYEAPQYQQYPQNFYTPIMPEDPYKGKAKAGMICGIVSLVLCVVSCCLLSPATLILSIFGIVYSAKAINKTTTWKNQATAGLTCSIIAIVLSLSAIVIYALSMVAYNANPDIYNEYSRQFSEQFGNSFSTFIRFLF